MTTLYREYKIYNFRWKDKKDVHILSTWGDVKDSDVKSRFNEETSRKPNMIIDYNKSMGGVDKLDQFRSYYDMGRAGKKFWRYIFYTYFNIAIINSFICFKKSKSTHARYSLLSYKNSLLHSFIDPYSKSISIPIVKSDSFTKAVTSDVVPGHRVVVYSSKRCVYCRDVLKCIQRTSYGCDLCRVSLCYYKGRRCFKLYHDSL